MKFLDETFLQIKAGKGGNGIVSFDNTMGGRADGGTGGNGGSVYFVGNPGSNTLFSLKNMKVISGYDGKKGQKRNMHGKNGKDLFVKIPLGTMVFKDEKLLHDIVEEKAYLVAKGGKGGRGNRSFKSSRITGPTISENGTFGQQFKVRLEIKVLADVGFVGTPSSGKSTILSKISNAKPKIASYSFTTLIPQLGFVKVDKENSFVVADLPGLIKNASLGKGLGIDFLKHIERCKVIAQVVDFGDSQKDAIKDFTLIRDELKNYSLKLEERDFLVVANKNDLEGFVKNLKKFKKEFPKVKVVPISALKEKNLELLKKELWSLYKKAKNIENEVSEEEIVIELTENEVVVENPYAGFYRVFGSKVKEIYDRIPLNTFGNIQRFNKLMKNIGVWKILEKKGVENGDTVEIFNYQMEWVV